MTLADHRLLDALCGTYLLGTLRGGARRRFERAIAEEPRVSTRLAHWRGTFATWPTTDATLDAAELDRGWHRLARELGLDATGARATQAASPGSASVAAAPAGRPSATRPSSAASRPLPWWRQPVLWQGWAAAASISLAVVVWRGVPPEPPEPVALRPLVELVDAGKRPVLAAAMSADGSVLELRPARPVTANAAQSWELWLIPAEGGAPLSVAVLGVLAARIEVPQALRARLRPGATLAVSVEPRGGSPTGQPTGPVIASGKLERA